MAWIRGLARLPGLSVRSQFPGGSSCIAAAEDLVGILKAGAISGQHRSTPQRVEARLGVSQQCPRFVLRQSSTSMKHTGRQHVGDHDLQTHFIGPYRTNTASETQLRNAEVP